MRLVLAIAVAAMLAGCSGGPEQGMIGACTDIVKLSAPNPLEVGVNSATVKESPVDEAGLRRFAVAKNGGPLLESQEAVIQLKAADLSGFSQAYAKIDFTDRSDGNLRGDALCWYLNEGDGYRLVSFSMGSSSIAGSRLDSVFVMRGRPKDLDSENFVK